MQVKDLEEAFAESLDAIKDADRVARAFGVALELPRVRDVTSLLSDLEDRASTASQVGERASGLLASLLELADESQPLMGQFVSDGADVDPWTTQTLKATLTRMSERTASAKPESTEGRPWGQPLKKLEGAPLNLG